MQPYRLEMGTRFENTRGKDLYAFWGSKITEALNQLLASDDKVLVNLASNEYFKSVQKNTWTPASLPPSSRTGKTASTR